jgi:WD40 repeat protein
VLSLDSSRILTAAGDLLSRDNTARLWDRNGKFLAIFRGFAAPVRGAEFARDGRRIITFYGETLIRDNVVRLWDADGQLLATLPRFAAYGTVEGFSRGLGVPGLYITLLG